MSRDDDLLVASHESAWKKGFVYYFKSNGTEEDHWDSFGKDIFMEG